MSRLEDPTAETCPDYASDIYEAMRSMLTNLDKKMSNEQVITKLQNAWRATQEKKIAAWKAQQRMDEEEKGRNVPTEQTKSTQDKQHYFQGDSYTKLLAERRKCQLARYGIPNSGGNLKDFVFDENRGLESMPTAQPARYAVEKLRSGEYIELDYFTPRSCNLASKRNSSEDSDKWFEVIKFENGRTVLREIYGKPLENIRADNELSWNEISMARHTMLKLMKSMDDAIWPASVVASFTDFFRSLDAHSIRYREHGDQAIVEYQAIVRKEWYNKKGGGLTVNDEKLYECHREIITGMLADKIREAEQLLMGTSRKRKGSPASQASKRRKTCER